MVKIGINGFGRIGRAIFRNNLESRSFEVAVINEINPDPENVVYTLNYDTLYDRLPVQYRLEEKYLVGENNDRIALVNYPMISAVDWHAYGVDFLIDATGVYQNVLEAHKVIQLKKAKKVFITHSPDNVDFTMVLGANEHLLDIDRHHVLATSICDATAIAPVMRILIENIGIDYGYVTTIHPWLSYQNLTDGPASSWSVPGTIYHHYALGRSAVGNLIPKPTTAIQATCHVLQHLNISEDMIGSFSYRPPTAIVGTADLTFLLSREATRHEVINLFSEYERKQTWRIVHNNWEPLVSLDFKKTDFSASVDHRWTDIIKGRMLKLVLWYDNEYGYASKVIDQVRLVSQKMGIA